MKILPTISLMMMLALTVSCSSEEDGNAYIDGAVVAKDTTRPKTLDDLEAKMGEAANWKANPKNYPKMYASLGKDAFDRSNEFMRWAVAVAADSPRCDKVDYGDVSDRSTPDAIVWFVDCINGERFYVDETQAKAAKTKWTSTDGAPTTAASLGKPQSAKLEGFDEARAVTECDRIAASALNISRSFDPSWGWSARKIPTVGRVEVLRKFEAKNAVGATLSSEYRCLLEGQTVIELSVSDVDGWKVVYRG